MIYNLYDNLSYFDLFIPPIYIFLIWLVCGIIKKKNISLKPEYRYFISGMMLKIVGAIALGLVYFFYYDGGGDTTNYYETAKAYLNLSFVNTSDFLDGWFGSDIEKDKYYFSDATGYPVYNHRDKHAFFVVRLLIPLLALSCKSYFTLAVVMAVVSFSGVWKLYQTFIAEFPPLKRELAIAVLFVPSCIFWGSGILKDSFTLSAVGWYTYAFYQFFILKNRSPLNLILILFSAYIIVEIKPYILFALLPGSIFWMTRQSITKIQNKTLRSLAGPLVISMGAGVSYWVLDQMGDSLGMYKMDSVMERAVIVQQDMKADYYGGKSFDIGNFDASAGSMLTKAPSAIFAGIFRPGIWDVKNIVMLASALENTYLLILTAFLLIKLKIVNFFGLIRIHPMLLFSMMFALFFAFSVGLTVANFGSLVRLRIPELPFFVSGIFILRYLYELKSGKKVKF